MRYDRSARRQHPPFVDGCGTASHRIGDAEPLQYPNAVGEEANSRADLADFMLATASDGTFVHSLPLVSQ